MARSILIFADNQVLSSVHQSTTDTQNGTGAGYAIISRQQPRFSIRSVSVGRVVTRT